MGDTYYENLGAKIRAFRKVKHISLSHVAQHLNKSLSTVAKYETGEIAIDVESLHKLCSYLGINISDLIPDSVSMYPAEDTRYRNLFVEKRYVYYYRAYDKWIHRLVIISEKESLKATLYFGVHPDSNHYNCKHIYRGEVHYSDVQTYYIFFNTSPPFDMITINAPAMSMDHEYQIGLLSSITVYAQNMAGKVLITDAPVDDRILLDKLRVTNEEIKELKRTNFFIV